MKLENMTCRQYVNEKFSEYMKSNYYKQTLKLKSKKPELAAQILNDKQNKYINEWKDYILEYGKYNRLDNKVIYSYIKEFGYNQLLHDFRRVKALEGWIPSKKYVA
jgi:vacuolar-type H+-ATPase subunit I/STV1